MQAKLRSTVVAAMLLAPAALTFLAGPAAAQQRAAAQPAITNMALNSDAGLSPGATLRVQVQATPNARRATIALGESGITVPLQQQAAGQYAGTYVVRRSDRIDPTQLMTARVTFGERVYTRQFNYPPAFQALSMGARGEPRETVVNARRDQHSPDITDLAPANGDRIGERGNTRISARLSDEGSGVDPSSVRVRLNGRDVSAEARVTDDRVVFRDDLEPGRYVAEVTVRDRAGNLTRKSWNFEVAERGRDRDRYGDNDRGRDRDRADRDRHAGSGPLPLQVTSHGNNMVVDGSGNLVIRGRTVPFATVRLQVESVVRAPGMYGVSTPFAERTVQADGNGHFEVGVNARGLPLPGTRYDVRVTATSG
ncbi:MAG TPA: hypothetical protein VNB23_05505, partial [Ramlibacter sp.]|nr:hypothetical protein [Ramlibacter sp.]